MRIRTRLVLMWLVLALPLQGYAAAAMLNCMAGHHRTSTAVSLSAVAAEAGEAHHAHHAAAAESAVALDPHHPAEGLSKSKCSACAACCVGAALPATALVFADAVPDSAPACTSTLGPIGFLTGGPDRPPRADLV